MFENIKREQEIENKKLLPIFYYLQTFVNKANTQIRISCLYLTLNTSVFLYEIWFSKRVLVYPLHTPSLTTFNFSITFL